MSKRELYEQKTEQLLTPIVEEYGFELVDVEYVKEGSTWYLRSYIDKPGGISIDDCETVSYTHLDVYKRQGGDRGRQDGLQRDRDADGD